MAKSKDVDSAVGKNGHASQIIILGHHFQNRINKKVDQRKNKETLVDCNKRQLVDIRL